MKKRYMTTGYKVTSPGLTSAITISSYLLQYKLNEWVKPKIGKIFFFKDLQSARNFRYDSRGQKIFKCSVVNPHFRKWISSHYGSYSIEQFWNRAQSRADYQTAPKGTMTCDELMLLEEV